MMRPGELRELFRRQPFVPIKIGMADGRSIVVRHPDQVVVAERTLLIGLAKIERSKPMLTPAKSETIAKEWMIVQLIQITSIEPEASMNGKLRRTRMRKKG
ncbi:MAG: hypothetical protein HY287_11175 [Planctomycetes bacterium]|nr:hypothetical protein [Planctomycetota bacterium]MBI3834880.1 hypothetical protein [Planctomycetota bacterium]